MTKEGGGSQGERVALKTTVRATKFVFTLSSLRPPVRGMNMSKRKPSKKYPLLGELPESKQREYTDVLLEEIRSQNRGVMECVQTMEINLRQDMQNMESKLSSQIEVTQMAVRSNKGEIIQIQKKLLEVETKLTERIDSVEINLSQKIDKVADKVEHHDEEITFLKTAIAKS